MALATLGSLDIGSIVKFNIDNSMREFIVVHQGKPSSIYDDSFNNTTMLLSRFRHENRAWNASNSDYANSDIHNYLNGAFLNSIDAQIRSQIVQVKVPYRPGGAYWSATVNSGANGLPTKIFLPSGYELNWTTASNPNFPADGATLSYFAGAALKDMRRSVGANYWLRSPAYGSSTGQGYRAWGVNDQGACIDSSVTTSMGVRHSLALPNSLFVTDDGTVIVSEPPANPTSINYSNPQAGRPIFISWR